MYRHNITVLEYLIYEKQESSSYNTDYITNGYHPLVTYDAFTKLHYFSVVILEVATHQKILKLS